MIGRHFVAALCCGMRRLVVCWQPPDAPSAADCALEPQGEGRVAAVVDGRSLRLEDGREIRLAGIERGGADRASSRPRLPPSPPVAT